MKKISNSVPTILPVIFLLVIWLCFVHMDMVPTRLENMAWFPDLSEQGDFLILTVVWMLAYLVVFWYTNMIVRDGIY